MASVSEVLNAGVPHSHWGLVQKQAAERDPGYGQEAVQGLGVLAWTTVWEPLTRLPGLAGAVPERGSRTRFLILPEAEGVFAASCLGALFPPKCAWNGFNTYFPGHLPRVRHCSRSWGHCGEPSRRAPALSGLTFWEWGEKVNSSVVTMPARRHLICIGNHPLPL